MRGGPPGFGAGWKGMVVAFITNVAFNNQSWELNPDQPSSEAWVFSEVSGGAEIVCYADEGTKEEQPRAHHETQQAKTQHAETLIPASSSNLDIQNQGEGATAVRVWRYGILHTVTSSRR